MALNYGQIFIYTSRTNLSGFCNRGHPYILLLAAWIFEDKLNENLQIPMIYFGQDIARMYGTFPADEASAYVSGMSQLKMYNLRFFDETGEYESFGEPNEYQPATVTKEQINLILNGDVVQVNRGVVSTTLVGLPFTSNGRPKPCSSTKERLPLTRWRYNFC